MSSMPLRPPIRPASRAASASCSRTISSSGSGASPSSGRMGLAGGRRRWSWSRAPGILALLVGIGPLRLVRLADRIIEDVMRLVVLGDCPGVGLGPGRVFALELGAVQLLVVGHLTGGYPAGRAENLMLFQRRH